MRTITFAKMVASGNDFVVTEAVLTGNLGRISRALCHRTSGIGADGLLVLEKSRRADVRMRVFNADGSEAEMCGNGARCVAQYLGRSASTIETAAGVIEARLDNGRVRVKLTDPKRMRLDVPLKIAGRTLRVHSIDTGVPHAVLFVEGLDKMEIVPLGRQIRQHKKFAPRGTNVNFVEVLTPGALKIRTYERGVENETLACGTGTVAAVLVCARKTGCASGINVLTRSTEVLRVYFRRRGAAFSEVWLEGTARVVFEGTLELP